MANTNIENTLRRLDDAAMAASLELDKAMHAAGHLCDFFDLRDEELAPTNGMGSAVLSNYKGAALDGDIVHDYIVLARNQIKDLRSALEDLYNLQAGKTN